MLNNLELISLILVLAIVTFFTRYLPFVLFPSNKTTPRFIIFLGQYLPPAIIGMLIVYCFKDIQLAKQPYFFPELIAAIFVVIIHKYKHNLLYSIAGGTILYMLLIQKVMSVC